MIGRLGSRLVVALLAGGMGWIAIFSWRGFVERPADFTGPALTAAGLIAVTGALLRGRRIPWWLVFVAQVLIVLVWFHHHLHVSTFADGWIPTPHGISAIAEQVRTGASAINTYAAPVRAARFQAPVYLLAVSILLLLSIDLIAAGLRRPTWSGLPVLIALTVPISVLDGGLSKSVFVGTAVLFTMLLATVETEQVLAWGQAVTGLRQRNDGTDQILDRASAQAPALKIGLLAAAGALVLPIFVPVAHGLLDSGPDDGHGRGSGEPVHLRNPMADLRRDLIADDHVPLLDVVTDSTDPTYLRTTVLDQFNGTAWIPGSRDLPETNTAQGRLPDPSGISPTTKGTSATWDLRTTADFITSWLPTPYLTRNISVGRGDWRYDITTLDIASADAQPPTPVSYQLTSFTPTFDSAKLAAASAAPADILGPMTRVPRLSDKVTRIAEGITAAGTTDYAKVVLLQDWFRHDGGFTYSLAAGQGNGMAQLERFITDEKVGYCEQFAAAMAVMARALGIPARVVVGFLEPEDSGNGGGGRYLYTSSDLHAWPEIFFRGTGWVRFEPTPSVRTGSAPSWTKNQAQIPTTAPPTVAPSQTPRGPTPVKKPTETAGSQSGGGTSIALLVRLGVLVLLLSGLMVPALLRRNQRRRRLAPCADQRAETENLWRELRATATDLGIRWPDGRSPRTAARVVGHRVNAGPDDVREMNRLVTVLEEARYRERFSLDEETRARSRSTVARWSQLLADSAPVRATRMARFLPRSAFERDRRTTPSETSTAGAAPSDNTYLEVR